MNESSGNLETSPNNSQAEKPAKSGGEKPSATNETSAKEETPKPQSLAELFGDSDNEESTEIVLGDDESDDPDAPVTSIDRLAKKNGLTAEQVYAITVPMPNGAEPLTIGELKDRVGELVDFELRETQFDERRVKQEGDILRAQKELQDLLSLMPKEAIKPEVFEKIRSRHMVRAREEQRLALGAIPEWHDEKRRLQDVEAMQAMLSNYGFDSNFLENIVDHRAIKFIRDTMIMRARITRSLESVRNKGKKTGRPSPKAAPPRISKETSNRRGAPTQRDRIMHLLGKSDS